MSNEKLKSENYQNFGGINNKISAYQNTPMEFLNITNFDFQTPGALTERWGSTMYIGQTFPGQINSIFEYQKLSGTSYVVVSYSGGIFYGATTGTYQGMSLSTIGATISVPAGNLVATPMFVDYGGGGVQLTSARVGYLGQLNLIFNQSYKTFITPQLQSDNKLSEVVFQDRLFMADGNKFLKFDGVTTTPVGLPAPMISFASGGATVNNAASGTTVGIGTTGSMHYGFYASYVNDRGFESQIWPIAFIDATAANAGSLGGSFIQAWVDLYTPYQYGISAINVYSYATSSTIFNSAGITYWSPQYAFLASYPASGTTTTRVALGTTTGNFFSLMNNTNTLPNPIVNAYFPLGSTLVAGSVAGRFGEDSGLVSESDITSYFPRMLEIYQNKLFCAGFSLTPSTVWFSDTGEPEGFQLANNFEVRTNDADVLTAMKAYATRLYLFKRNSLHALLGDNPANFSLQEVTLNYGALNNRSALVYEDTLVFLDRKGVMIYNGAKPECLSDKVQPFFDRMNYNVALNTAVMAHDKLRNQLVVGIPIDGATLNNITIVYDYLAKAWTTHKGYSPSVFATVQGYNNTKNLFYGSYSGTINWFGPSFISDNGVGFTSYFKPRFLHDMGDSVQKQFRRLYINADTTGATYTMPINFFQDYGTSTVLSTTMVMSSFQKRIDYGVSAKSLTFELFNLSSTSPLKIFGFTVESRLQRRV